MPRGGTGNSLRQNIVSSLWGNSLYNLSQWLLVVVVARIGSPDQVGDYALSLAITAPVFLGVGLNLRIVQSTDASRRWTPAEYMRLRMVLNVAAFGVTVLVGVVMGSDRWFLATVMAMGLAKATEGASQVSYGYFQRRSRMDLVASSLGFRAVAGLIMFTGVFAASETIWLGVLGLFVAWTAVGINDRRHVNSLLASDLARMQDPAVSWPRLLSLARLGVPVGVDAAISSLATNVPRYGISAAFGQAALGLYTPIAYLGQLMSLVGGAVGSAVLPRLSDHHQAGALRPFLRLIGLMIALSVVLSAIAVTGAYVLGDWAVALVFGEEYANQPLLVAVMIAFSLVTLQRSLGRALNATQSYWTYLGIDVVTTGVVAAAGLYLIEAHGLPGAAWSIAAGFAVGVIMSVVAIGRAVVGSRRDSAPPVTG